MSAHSWRIPMRSLAGILLLIAGLGVGGPARAGDFLTVVNGLGSDTFSERVEAIQAIAASGEDRAAVILTALEEGRLYVRLSDSVVVIAAPESEGFLLTGAADGSDQGTAEASAVDQIIPNNRIRTVLTEVRTAANFGAGEASRRLAAARGFLRAPVAVAAPALQKALETETVPEVKEALTIALAAARIADPDVEVRRQAVIVLSETADPLTRNLTQARLADETDPMVRRALEISWQKIDGKLQFRRFGLTVFQGVSLGSILLLAALGLAVTFGVMGVINMAHGEMIMLGAYSTFVVQEAFRAWLPASVTGAYLPVAVPVAFLVSGAAGILIERTVIRWLYGRPLETLLATWGISLMLQQLVRSIFGAPNKEVANPEWLSGGIELPGDILFTYNRIAIIAFCIFTLLALALILRRTAFGLHMRAVTQNRRMAASMGIPTGRVDALTFGLGSGLAGVAGVALSQVGNVSPNLGQTYIIDSFMVVVFGGVGNLWGTLVGGLSLGLVNKFLEPYAGAVLGKILVLVCIILFIQKRPRGLFALKGRAVES